MAIEIDQNNPCNSCLLPCKPIKPYIPENSRFLIVTKGTSNMHHIRAGLHLTKESEEVVSKNFAAIRFKKNDFAVTSSVLCAYNPELYKAKDKQIIEKCCRIHLKNIIEDLQPEVIIPMGAESAKAVKGRNCKITKVRGVIEYNEEHKTFVLPILDPAQVASYPQHQPLFASDCKTLRRVVDHKYDLAKVDKETSVPYIIVDDLQFLVDAEPEKLVFDIETKGLDCRAEDASILTMQFCINGETAYILPWDHPESFTFKTQRNTKNKRDKLISQIKSILINPNTRVCGQNISYDALWVLEHFGFRFRLDSDTLCLATEIDENLQNKNLDTLIKIHVPELAGYADSFNSKYDKSRMDLVPLQELAVYGGGDVVATYKLWEVLEEKLLKDKKAWNRYRRVVMPGISIFTVMEHNGIEVDENALSEFQVVMEEYVKELETSLIKQIPKSIKRKHLEKNTSKKNLINLRAKDLILDTLFFSPDGFKLKPVVFTKTTDKLQDEFRVPSTSSKEHLPYFFDICPFTVELAEWVKMDRLLHTNIISFKNKYIKNGRIHPSYNLTTATTGRTSSKNPNGQNEPTRGKQAKAYKRIFVAPPGYVLLICDLSQAELRIVADMSRDRTMIKVYQENGDIHTTTAIKTMGVTEKEFKKLSKDDQKLSRFKSKAINFGYVFGMGWRKFIGYAKTQYMVEFTEQESKNTRQNFFDLYSSLSRWHEAMRQFATEHGYVRSYSGKIRHLPMIHSKDESVRAEAGRQSINAPVQCFASDLGVTALSRVDQEVDTKYLLCIRFVHDALYALVPEQYTEWGAKTLQYYMQSNPIKEWFGIDMKVPILADVSFGRNASDQYEMQGLCMEEKFDFKSLEEEYDTKFNLPRQKNPPNNGRLRERPYPEIEVDIFK